LIEAGRGNMEQATALLARSTAIRPPNVQFIENYATALCKTLDYARALGVPRRPRAQRE
jgi:hypothetical protein